jgi:hypothetical protein
MTPHRVPERDLGELTALPKPNCLAERRREWLWLTRCVSIADKLWAGIGPIGDAIKPGGE